jgi:hypothetical protein
MTLHGILILASTMSLLAIAQTYFMLTTFAFLTGWRRLARTHPGRKSPLALPALHATQGVLLDAWGWNAPPLRVGHDREGIVLRPLAMFRPVFPTVKVPWSALVAVERRQNPWGEVLIVYFGPDGRDSLSFLPSALSAELRKLSPGENIRNEALPAGNSTPDGEM